MALDSEFLFLSFLALELLQLHLALLQNAHQPLRFEGQRVLVRVLKFGREDADRLLL